MNNKRKTKYKGKRKCDHRHLREAGSECYVALKKKEKKKHLKGISFKLTALKLHLH